jgi:diguanylate cyclase (GGDEF)-like protein
MNTALQLSDSTAHLVAENQRLREELERTRNEIGALLKQATTDELTGLLNRRGFLRLAEEELRFARARLQPLTMIYVDVDGLKELNDSAGHEEGDVLLIETAMLLRRVFRATDVVARLGGDEFVVLTRDFHGSGDVVRRRIAQVSEGLHRAGVQSRAISLSAGVIVVDPYESPDLGELLSRADKAMYSIKRSKLHDRRRRAVAGRPTAEIAETQQDAA